MTTLEFIKKYPNSISYVGNIVSNIMKLKRNNDYDSIKKLGLSEFLSDMRKTFGTSKEFTIAQREKKFERILNDN